MQGVRFRKYIRNNYFDVDLLAKDLSLCLWEDNGMVVAPGRVRAAFVDAFENMGIGETSPVQLETPEGCFAVYPQAMETIGEAVGELDANPFAVGDEWIHEAWPSVSGVVNHLYAQIMEAITPESSNVFYGSLAGYVQPNRAIRPATKDTDRAAQKLANLLEAGLEKGFFE